MKVVLTLLTVLASISAHAVSGPAYQNMAKMNEIVQSLVKLDDDSISTEDLVQEADDLELAKLVLTGSGFEVYTSDKFCTGEIKLIAAEGGMGSNPTYKAEGLTCKKETNGQKTVPWSLVELKVLKRAKTGKATSFIEVNQLNRRVKLK